MIAIIGLGNPGSKYKTTRHNIGFQVIDKLADKLNVSVTKIKFKSVYGETTYKGQKVLLMKPQTYMNESGQAVRELVNFYKLKPEELVVVFDDIDIGFSDIKIKKQGSAGTHNGMRSIIYQIQTDEFPRIKIGIGKKRERQDLADFVLSEFSKDEQADINIAIEDAAEAIITILDSDLNTAMNKYNIKRSSPS